MSWRSGKCVILYIKATMNAARCSEVRTVPAVEGRAASGATVDATVARALK